MAAKNKTTPIVEEVISPVNKWIQNHVRTDDRFENLGVVIEVRLPMSVLMESPEDLTDLLDKCREQGSAEVVHIIKLGEDGSELKVDV